MASQQAIATKRVNAVRTIETASTALAKKLNIELTPLPNIPMRYDADYSQAMQLEHLGGILQKIAIATGSAKDKDFEVATPPASAPEVPEAVEEVVEETDEVPTIKRKKK